MIVLQLHLQNFGKRFELVPGDHWTAASKSPLEFGDKSLLAKPSITFAHSTSRLDPARKTSNFVSFSRTECSTKYGRLHFLAIALFGINEEICSYRCSTRVR
jgi:hypothetical protein